MDIYRILDQARFFEGISRSSKEALSKFCMPAERSKLTTLFRDSEPGEAMYLLARGRVSLHKLSPDGHETVINLNSPNFYTLRRGSFLSTAFKMLS